MEPIDALFLIIGYILTLSLSMVILFGTFYLFAKILDWLDKQ